tara:strand:+ start:1061 stop:1681 length:621 start_codon:yes stop_codon:yes gene_type:complete
MRTSIRQTLSKIKNKIIPQKESRLVATKETHSVLKPRLHIGCGPINLEGWINIDARDNSHVHINTHVIDLKDFSDNSIGEIYLCHVLEHFSFEEVSSVLDVFYRKLQPGGLLRISVPDFRLMAQSYLVQKVGLHSLKYALMGGQDYQYNFHKSIYDYKILTQVLSQAGFSNSESYDTVQDLGLDLGDWSTGKIAGQLISLNVKAKK